MRSAAQPHVSNEISHWGVGITTAPREIPTLDATLDSVSRAGFTEVQLFAEPDTPLPSRKNSHRQNVTISQRGTTLGAFPNWYVSLTELVLSQPKAKGYLLLQDDAELAASLVPYLEQIFPECPLPQGIYSLYCPAHEARPQTRGFVAIDPGWQAWGALAYLVSPLTARRLLTDRSILDHRPHGPAAGLKNIDSVVGWWCRRAGVPYFVHQPSLVRHLGETSTLWPHATATGQRQARDVITDASATFSH
ncbi:hypothetical protein [Planctopirus hydrillae]|uniref:Glycosyltransferase n=1 Tax=Planctopirus hydrillae TaxID=1841610 RepID=A0A1C3EE08_9PLAN|nr:hypothetical protein [Planctopirus hydrillae]ODA31440.1 hypothetical protein A6X21_22415 [Planctopirus hydrillae]